MTDLEAPAAAAGPVGGDPPRRGRTRVVVLAVVVAVVAAAGVGAWAVLGRGGDGTPRISAGEAVVGASGADAAAAYLVLSNSGSADDRLVRVTSPEVGDVSMHITTTEGGLSTMRPVDGIDVPAGGSASLEPGGSHLMLSQADHALRAGDTVTLHLEFEHAPPLDVRATVVPLADLADRVGR